MAFEQFYQKNNTFQLLIVGSNMWGDKKLVIPNSISNAVGFTGHVELEALSKIMAGAFAFVYPPYFEGFGIPLIEAMKSGVPVLSSNKTCLPEVAGDAALFFDPFNVNDIAKKLEIISKDELLRETLIKRGYKKSQDYNWDKAAKQTWQTLEKFIKAP
jgi:glycosyltransferase involved in cell wall biosynthesis